MLKKLHGNCKGKRWECSGTNEEVLHMRRMDDFERTVEKLRGVDVEEYHL